MLFRRMSTVQPVGQRAKQLWQEFDKLVQAAETSLVHLNSSSSNGNSHNSIAVKCFRQQSQMDNVSKLLNVFLDIFDDESYLSLFFVELMSSGSSGVNIGNVVCSILDFLLLGYYSLNYWDVPRASWELIFVRSIRFLNKLLHCSSAQQANSIPMPTTVFSVIQSFLTIMTLDSTVRDKEYCVSATATSQSLKVDECLLVDFVGVMNSFDHGEAHYENSSGSLFIHSLYAMVLDQLNHSDTLYEQILIATLAYVKRDSAIQIEKYAVQHGHSSGSSVNSTGSGAGGVGKSGNLRHSVSWSVPDGEFNEELDLEAGSSSVAKESTNEFVTNNENKPVSLARRSLTMAVSAVSEILKYTPLAGAGEWLGRTVSSSAGNGDDTGDLSAIMMSRLHAEFLDLVPDVTIPASLLLSESNKYTLVENEIKNSLMETLPSNSDRNGAYLSGMTVPLGESHALKDNICDTLVMHGLLKWCTTCLRTCSTPETAVLLLEVLQHVLFGNPSRQLLFSKACGYDLMFKCALRNYHQVDALCEDERLSVGSVGDVRTSATSAASVETNPSPVSNYLDRLLEIFLLLILDDTTGCDGTTIVLNIHALECIKRMIWCKCTPMLQLALDLIKALLSCNPIYALVLEKSQIFLAVYGVLAVLVFRMDEHGAHSEVDNWIDVDSPPPVSRVDESNATDNLSRMREMFYRQSCKVEVQSNTKVEMETENERELYVETKETNDGRLGSVGMAAKLSCLQDALYVIQHASVSLAELSLGCTGLNYLVVLLYSVASCKMVVPHNSLNVGQRSARNSVSGTESPKPFVGNISAWSMPSYCMNCECESATVHCLHASCIEEKCCNLCQDCDKVFHKAASKRTHVRMPCSAVGPVDRPLMRSIVQLLPEELRYIVYGMQEWHFSRCYHEKSKSPVIVSEVVALLLGSIRGIIDDRRSRCQSIPGVLLGTLLQSVRICCTQCPAREGNAGFAAAFAGNSLFANILSISRVNRGASDNISFGSRLRDNRVRFADFRDDIVSIQHSNGLPSANESNISAHGGVDDIAVRTLDTYEDPPEDHQSLPIRVCISIGIQIISRFFVSEIIASCSREAPITGLGGLSDKSSSPTVPNGHNMLFGTGNVPGRFVTGKKFDSSCTRAEMYSRISMFQKCGGMALLVHLVINGGTFTPLCKCDKQFALWTMREIIVCSSEVNVRRINMSLQWLVWLLNCPVIVPGGPGMSSHSPRKAQSSSSFSRKPSSKNIHMHEYSELEWMPSARPAISAECRLMVLQEVRLLIGGDMLENVLDTVSPSLLVSEIARMPNKVFGNEEPDPPTSFVMPHLPDVASNIFENAVMRIGVNSSVSSSTGSGTTTPSHARGKSGKVHKYIPVAQQQSIAFSRVPISSATLKMHLVGCGILKSLFSLLFGDMCDASISEVLDSGFYSGNASASQDKGIFGNANVCELAVETWWSALGTLYLLILGSDAVKNEIDVEIGIDALCKRLFPFLSMSDAPSGIGQLVMELCVSNGNVAPVPHCPFLTVAKVPRLKVVTSLSATGSLSPPHSHGHHQNHPNLLNSHAHSRNTANETTPHPLLRRPQYDMLDFSSFIGDIDGENLFGGSCSDLISLSSVYYIRERSLAFMVDCLRPMKLKLSPHMSTAESTVGNSSSGIPRLIRSSSNTSNFSDVSVEETSKRSVGVHRDSSSHSLRDLEIVHDMMEIVPGNVGGTRGRSTSSSSSASSSSYHSASALLMFRNTLTKATPSPTPSLNGGVGAEKSSSFSRLGPPNKGGNFHAPSAHNSFVPLLRRLSGSLFPESHALFSVLESKLSEKYNIVRQATISPDIISDSDSCRNVPGSFGSTQLHMSCFSSSKPGTTGDIKMTSWRPCFSRVNLRNKESAELIFSMVLLTIGTELHMQLISLLSHLIDGNPENGRLIMKSTNLAVAVFELIGLMPDKQKGTFAYLLSQLLRYETNQQSLDMFMRYCRKMPCSNVDCIVILDELLAVKSCPELDDGCVDESKKELSSGQVVMTEDSADTDAADASIVSTLKPKSTSNMTHLLGYALQRADAQLQSQRESDVVDNSKSLVVKELLSQVLYILGRLVERDFPSAYIHFDHSSVILKNCLLFPRINIRRSSGTDQDLGTVTDSILSDPLKLKEECNLLGKKTAFRKMLGEYSKADGLSLCTWVRLGSLGDATIGTFMQFSGSTCGAGLDVGAGFGVHDTADSKLYNYVVDVYFRVVYRPTSIGDDERGSVASGISTLPGEMAHCEESSKRCLQLCMSFSFNEANTNPSNSESSVRDNEKLLDSLAGFGIPDVVIDYDWSEMGDWHLLYVNLANVSFSREESGTVKCFPNFSCGTRGVKIECFVDGEEKMVYYWNGEHGYCCNHAALACLYQPRARFGSHHSASSVNNGAWYNHHVQQQTISPSFPSVSCCTTGVFPWKCEYNSMDISLGGVHHEHAFIRKMIRSLALWSHGCVMGVGTFDEDVSSIEDLRLLQTYNSMVCGFSGTLSEVYVLLGDMNSQLLNSIYEKGASRSLCEFISSSHVATCLNVESVAAGLDAQQTAANIRSAENTGGLSTNNSTASASNLTANPAYLTESRGRSDIKNVTDSSGSKRSSSRSISPGLRSARMMHASDAVQNTHNPHSDSARVLSLSPAKHILPPGNGVSAVVSKEEVAEPPSSTSLVSELFTLFSSSTTTAPPADPNSSANNTRSNRGSWRGSSKDTASPLPRVSGCNLDALPQGAGSSILYDNGSAAFDGLLASSCGFQVYDTELVSDSFQHIGGIKALYPLLLVDRTRQIAGLRIIASLVASYEKNLSVLSGNELVKAENLDNFYAILYCLYSTPNHLSLESVQVLFELIVVSGEGKSVAFASTGATSSNCDKNKGSGLSNSSNSSKLGISPLMKQRAVPSAHTSVDIIHRPALLTLLVDVVVANPCKPHVAKGVIEWLKNICEDVEINIRTVLTEIGLVPFLIILCLWNVGDADLKIMTPFLGSQCDENKPLPNGEKHIKCGVPMSPSEASRLQSQVSKFIKQLICGTYGDPFNMPSGWISDSSSGSRPNPSNLHTTPTGFTVQHLASLLIFIGKISRDHTQYVAENHGETSSADTYRSNAATNLLDVVLAITEGPLMLTMLHMFRLALPGSAMWYLVFDLISSPSILIRIRGLRLLCFSFYTLDGYQQLDLKQLTAFEKLQGFSMMSEFLGRYETDDRTMGLLLTLLFWRTRVVSSLLSAPGGQYMPHGAQNFRTDMHLNEQIGVSITDNSSEMETLLANDDALLIDRDDEEDDEESEDDEDEMADIHECEGGNLSLNLSFQEEIDLVYASQEGRAPGEAVSSKGSGIGTAHSVETVELEPTGQKMEKPPLPTKLNNSSNKHNVELIKIPQMLQVLFRSLYNAKTVSVVEMAMRALCDCICMCNYVNMDGTYYSMFNHFLCSSQLSFVLNTAGVIDRGFSLHRMSLEEFVKLQITASRRNFETLCLQKDWLLWACECLVALQIRFLPKNSTTIDSKGTRGADVANNTAETLNIYNDSVYQFIQMVFMIDMMEKPNTYRTVLQLVRLPPMYANEAVQGVESQFHSGVVDPNSWSCVASSSEATNMTTSLQIMVLYDIFDSFESCNLFNDALSSIVTAASASVNTSIISVVGGGSSTGSKVAELSMNLLKNFGLLLEQLHERVLDFYTFCMPVSANANVVTNSITNAELNPNALLNLALYERILEVIDTLSVNTLPSIRNRLKETLLYEMRSVFVAKILMENLKNFDEYLVRATSLLKVRASLQNSITSTENKLLIDTQVLHLLLNWFTGVTEEIAVVQEELYEMRKSATMEPGRYDHCKHRLDNSLFPAQFMYLELIQMCIGVSSSECRKYIQRLGVELGTSIAKYNAYVTNTQAQGRDNHQSGDQNQNRDSDIDTGMQEDILVEVDGNAATILLDGLRNTLELPAIPITASNSSDVVSKHTGDGTATTVVGYEKPNESIGTVTSSQGSSWWSSWATSNSGVANSTSESGSGSPAVTYYTASKRSNSLYGTRPALGDVESGISSSDRVEFERVGSNHSDVSYITENTEFPFYPLDSSEFLHWYNALEQRDFHHTFANKVMKEYRLVLKVMERHQDKFYQRKVRHSKTLSEKYFKDRIAREKMIKDAIDKYQNINTKVSSKCASDFIVWTEELLDKIRMGEQELKEYVCTVIEQDMSNASIQNEGFSSNDSSIPLHSFPEIKVLPDNHWTQKNNVDVALTSRIPQISKWLENVQKQQELKDKAFYHQNMMKNKKFHSQDCDRMEDKHSTNLREIQYDKFDCRVLVDELIDFFAYYK